MEDQIKLLLNKAFPTFNRKWRRKFWNGMSKKERHNFLIKLFERANMIRKNK